MKDKIRNENSGFTLIELVITIAVLAVISVPLLMYFTDSMRHSARMKEEQNAVVAAQNVLEELKVIDMSLDDIDLLTLAVTPPPGATPYPVTSVTWEPVPTSTPDPAVTPDPAATPGAVSDSYEVQGQYKVNNQSYMVKAKITPRHQWENFDSNIKTYQKAKAPTMNSSKDMIITEKSAAMEPAKLYFYEKYAKYCDDHGMTRDPSITIDSMEECLERTIHIKAAPEKNDAGVYTGKVVLNTTYEYRWKSGKTPIDGISTDVSNPTKYTYDIADAVLDGTGSHNILLFYTPIHYGSPVTVVPDTIKLEGQLLQVTGADGKIILGNPGVADDKLQYHLYLVADGTIDRSTSPAYKTTLQGSDVSSDNFSTYISEVYTNLKGGASGGAAAELQTPTFAINAVFPSASGSGSGFFYDTLVESPEANRIAEIEVSVYKDKADNKIHEDALFTTVNGTKVQSQ